MEPVRIMRAWDRGLNKIAYVYRNQATGKKAIGEVKFDWFFYVLTSQYEQFRSVFKKFEQQNVINRCESEGIYTRIYADYPHKTESLTKEMEPDWSYKSFCFNEMLDKLKVLECQTYEADITPSKRFCLQDYVSFEQEYKVLFLDIETDDRIRNGQPIPGEFRILSCALKDADTEKEAYLVLEDDTDEEEIKLLTKLGKLINGYDVLVAWNGCFPKDTRITMHDGSYKNIQDINLGDSVLSYNNGRSELSVVKHLFKHKRYNAVYKITTDKREIIASDEHPFLATYSNVNRWVRAKNLRAGDYLTKFRRIDLSTERRDYRPEDYLFCGMIMTDGHIPTARPGCFDFHTTSEQYLRWMKKYLTRNGIHFEEYVKRDDNPNHKKQYQLKCKNVDYWKMLLDLGVPTGRKTEKPIDLSKLYQQSRNRIKMFLLGLWIGDGYKTQKHQQFICNQNVDLNEWCVKLFARIGQNWYSSKFSKDGSNYFRGVGKVQQDHIPIHYVKKATINNGYTKTGALCDIMNEKTPCTSGQFNKFFTDNGDVSALSFEQIISIEIIPFDDYVYNFETENHTYIADDLIVHNCSFDFPYIKARMMRYGIQLDWRKVFLQDQMKIFQKSVSLRSYSLENVSQEYLGEGKVDHTGMGIYEMWKSNPALLKKYNGVDTHRMFQLEQKTKYLSVARNVNAIGMCPCDDLFITRKIDNLVVKQAQIDKHYHFETIVKEWNEDTGRYEMDMDDDEYESTYEGAYVFPPFPGRYKNVKVFDFASLYPNVIKTFNISPDTLVPEDFPDELCIKTPSGHKFRKDFVGILPKVITGMKEKRDFYKALMSKEVPGTLMHKTYDNLQYVYKSFGLSFYGALGEKHTRFYDTRVAESVTLGGQYFTKECAKYLVSKGYKIIYGDTDSVFVYGILTDEQIPEILKALKDLCAEHAINGFGCVECTLEMAYDKGFRTFLIANAKKRYAGNLDYIDGHEINPYKLKITGFEYVRTDQCGFVKKYQKEMLEWILSDNPPPILTIRDWILKQQMRVVSGKLTMDELVFSQKITKPLDQYASELPHTKVAKQMITDGKDCWVGDKVQYFIECFDTRKKPFPRPAYAFNSRYNETYYWNNKIFPAFERILTTAYPSVKWGEYYLKGNSAGSVRAGRRLLWD